MADSGETISGTCCDYLGHFRKEFYDHYFLVVYQDIKQSEFFQLVQGSLTIEAYEKNFVRPLDLLHL